MRLRDIIIQAAAVALLGGCASTGSSARSPANAYEGLGMPTDFVTSINGYRMSEGTRVSLTTVAGIYAGTIRVKTDGQGSFSARGSYSQFKQPEAMVRALREADTDGNKIITDEEEIILSQRVMEQHAQIVEGYQRESGGRSEGRSDFYAGVNCLSCDFDQRSGVGDCSFTRTAGLGDCGFDYNSKKGGVRFDRILHEGDCRFDISRGSEGRAQCLDEVAQGAAQRIQEVDADYQECVGRVESDFKRCEARSEREYRACLER